jgi:hypothetical protein
MCPTLLRCKHDLGPASRHPRTYFATRIATGQLSIGLPAEVRREAAGTKHPRQDVTAPVNRAVRVPPFATPHVERSPASLAGLFSFLSRRYAKPMTDHQQAPDYLARLRPPTVTEAASPPSRYGVPHRSLGDALP